MTRQEGNKKLLEILAKKLEENPDLRFIQTLWGLNIIDSDVIIDRFFEEPSETLKRIKNE